MSPDEMATAACGMRHVRPAYLPDDVLAALRAGRPPLPGHAGGGVMSALVPLDFEGRNVRMVQRDEVPWWVLADRLPRHGHRQSKRCCREIG